MHSRIDSDFMNQEHNQLIQRISSENFQAEPQSCISTAGKFQWIFVSYVA